MEFFYPEVPSPGWIQTGGAQFERLVIHCWAEWNGYDLQMHRQLVSIREKLDSMGVQLRSLDIQNEIFWPFLREHRVLSIPTLMLFSSGKHLNSCRGLAPPEVILRLVAGMIPT